ncbi:hypothetical protein GBA63_02850 [Rubrobacter tropicus]|uniref:Uncharacterized protein n=1 Tax=Rubrobacter tropicus TaxID=2653851 RepID=A0A6G8Q5G9_9ACTN|nr:hypothetical protein [Rubrobacter tropicus]QIN81688.1 hypothetical protein GBA63_02850 [Rubrobacter tropicus]
MAGRIGRVGSLFVALGKGGYAMALGERRTKRRKTSGEKPYIYTTTADGRKYIKSDEFIELPHVEKQMRQMSRLAKSHKGRLGI